MKKSVFVFAILAVLSFGSQAVADELVPGQKTWVDQSVMGVGQSVLERGASARAATNIVNSKSRANLRINPSTGVDAYTQFGSSQTEQSWKAQRTVEEASVRGLVVGDCQGDNSDEAYRRQMGQNRAGYTKEPLVSNADCGANHPTYK